jgi:hypothetical protein
MRHSSTDGAKTHVLIRSVSVIVLAAAAAMIAGTPAQASPGAGMSSPPAASSGPAVDRSPHGFFASSIVPSWHLVVAGHGTSLDVVSDAVATGDMTMYMTGALGGATTGHDLSLTKCVRGQIVWSKTYDGPGHGYDAAIAVAARGGAVYTTGSRQSARGDGDLVLIRWNTAGDRVWTRAFDSGEHLSDGGIDVAVDADGNVVVVGESEINAGALDAVVLKYTSAGRRLWIRRYDGAAHGPDLANHVVVDPAGRIYAAGWTESMTNEADSLVVKYSAAGRRLWTRRFNGSGDGRDELVALVARPGGGVYAAGTTIGATSGEDALLLAYTAAGKRSFVATATGMTGGTATAQGFNDLVAHRSGDVWCCGYDASSTVGTDCLCAAYDGASGVPRRTFRESSPGVRDDRYGAIATDRLGAIYLTGRWATGAATSQTYTKRWADDGAHWTCFYPTAATGLDGGACVVTHGINAFVAGTHHDPATGYDQISLAFIY